jgi:hypothetical protein
MLGWREKIASRVFVREDSLMSVMATRSHPAEANAFATAAPIPRKFQQQGIAFSEDLLETMSRVDKTVPVPPAPVMTATPGNEYARTIAVFFEIVSSFYLAIDDGVEIAQPDPKYPAR